MAEGLEPSEEAIRLLGRAELQQKLSDVRKEVSRITSVNDKLRSDIDNYRSQQANNYNYLHEKLKSNHEVIADLEGKITEHRQMRAKRHHECREELASTRRRHEEEIANLKRRQVELQHEVEMLEDFVKRRQELVQTQSRLQKSLEEARKQNARATNELRNKNEREKERLRAEMESKINDTRRNMIAQTEDRLSVKTKRTILENEKIRNELQYQSRESTKLAMKFRNLEKENALLRKRLTESREAEADAAKRMHARQRQVRRLDEQLRAMEDEQRQRPLTGATESPSVGGNAQALHDQLADAERQVEALQKPLAEAKREFREIVMLQDDFVKVMLASMVEVMNQVARDGDLLSASDELSVSTTLSSWTGVQVEQWTKQQRARGLGLLLARLHNYQLVQKTRPAAKDNPVLPRIVSKGS